MRYIIIIAMLIILGVEAKAQDPQFSQYYAAPLYLNPAFAGTGANHRFIANYRNQWPSLANGFVTYAFSYDYNLDRLRSGVGFLATVDKAGSANLTTTNFNFIYSYKIELANKWVLTPGLSFGYGSRNVDFDKLIFGDQLDFQSDGQVPTSDLSATSFGNAGFFDFGAGILLYNKSFWAGFSAAHINEPNRSLLGEESIVPMKKSLHAGFRVPLYHGAFKRDRISSLAPSFIYKSQGDFDQLDVGMHFLYAPVMVGLWYRGIPLQQNVNDNISHDAVVVILGMQFDNLELGYSYDFTVSELGAISGGAHEISLMYSLDAAFKSKVKKKDKFIPCPTFNK